MLAFGTALQSFRDTRPLLQKSLDPCRSGLVSRKGRTAAPIMSALTLGQERWQVKAQIRLEHPLAFFGHARRDRLMQLH
ncbi:hypothetical protein DZC31_26820 [Stenotrophomonas rhizophila]|nr:hypothetical protein DZC31_26820 [Stenotrophomonas rhizophila]